ncbi:heat stress transcription factor A-1e [Euphorbia lathyris]|uniref:heat stress transcription factor A-1e n=1 Tax=Euphorbia lathyris TaxID=212925 RepID=UPI0033143CDE
MESAYANTVPPFLCKTYDMVDDPSTNSVVSWTTTDNSFVVWNVPEFQKELLPKYFKHNNFSSFVRQLNTYGFRKVDPDRFEFANEGFLRGQKHLLKTISRKKPLQGQGNQPPQVNNVKVPSCVEVGKFGIDEEVEGLKRDKNALMQELVRLRQQQQTTDNQLQAVGQRVQVMEQRQQQMMSFLAKAMQNPGFLNQFVQQKNDSNRRIRGTKKRRLPGQEEENLVGKVGGNPPNGRVVKFHSSMNEAAKDMLNQILNMNSPSRLETSMNNSGQFLLGDLPSSGVMDSSSTSTRFSEVMLPEVQPATSGPSFIPADSGFSVNYPSNAVSEVQSPCYEATDHVKTSHIADMAVTGSSAALCNVNFLGSSTMNEVKIDPATSVLDAFMPAETDAFSPDEDADILVDGNANLPSIGDVFWEQFLTASPLTGDTDEINSSSPESQMTREQELHSWQENGWDNIQRMNHLTEQMEILGAASRSG